MKCRAAVVLVLVAALGLAGCSTQAGPRVLNREATAEDKLPDSVGLSGVDLEVEPGSARLVATHDDVKYYVAKSKTGGAYCLFVVPVGLPERWRAGCSGPGTSERIVTVSGADRSEATLINDGVDTNRPEFQGLTKIHDNVLISEPSPY
ncbi:hypothetical protein [Paenarthrobacter nitroguajacolicus]|uniref:hypothetical protein n=1 Tax=Paenarthrobacter nitroguajacolicus TaxID=211146 RepID=UPI00248BF137|nr:hypothetical protein [Paenarthrobacter nitroguajacolicus]MDI2034927.1 hypothetical protein [Paenarthrobacter nitroguajacolicus]